MFNFKKEKKELDLKQKELEKLKQDLIKEKHVLAFIKNELKRTQPFIDVTNVYVWIDDGIYNIVKYDISVVNGNDLFGNETSGYKCTLIDIFNNKVIYQKCSKNKIEYRELVGERIDELHYVYLKPLYEVDKNILAFVNNKVPLYVLQQLYYKLNNIDVKEYLLKK